MRNKWLWLLISSLLVAALILSSCGPAEDGEEEVVEEEEEGGPQYGGVLKLVQIRNPVSVGYPVELTGVDGSTIYGCLEKLWEIGPDFTYTPMLATSWDVADDTSNLTIKLREGVTFHDGTKCDAEAVKWNLDLAVESGKILNNVTSIDVVDDHTIRLNFDKFSNLTFAEIARDNAALIISPTSVEQNGKEWAKVNPVGTGPFVFKNYERGVDVEFGRNDNYWEDGVPYLDGFSWAYVPEQATRDAMLKSGEVHGHQDVMYLTAATLPEDEFNIHTIPNSNHGFMFNTSDPDNPFSDKRVREAVEYAIDKVEITKNVTMGFFHPLYQAVPEGVPGHVKSLESEHRIYDPEKAKQLLAEAGYPNGIDFKLNVMAGWEMDVITAMQATLADAGINMEIEILERGAQLDLLNKSGIGKNHAAAYYFSWYSDTLLGLKTYFKTRFNPEMVRPPEFYDLLERAEETPDPAVKKALVEEIIELIHDEVIIVPWWELPRVFVMNKSVKGYEIFKNNEASYLNFFKAWIDE